MKQRSALWLLLVHELRSMVRDQRTILLAVVVPLVLMPVLFLGQQQAKKSKDKAAQARTYAYVVDDGDAEEVALLLGDDADGPPLERKTFADATVALQDGDVAAALALRTNDEGLREVEIRYRGNSETSRTARDTVDKRLRKTRDRRRADALAAAGSSIAIDQAIVVTDHDVAEKGHSEGARLGRFLTALMVFLIVLGGQVAAADLLAGEKERGTLETLLTTAARREDIVNAKLLTILVVAIVITGINLGNLMVYVTLGFIPGLDELASSLPPIAVLALGVVLLPVTLVISALLLLLSGYARSYKEAQLFGFPVQLGLLVPAMASVLPGLPLRSAIVFAPIANASVAVREILSGRFDWPMIVAIAVVNLAVGLLIARATTRALKQERLISAAAQESAELQGGQSAFRRNIWNWVFGAWAVFLLIALNFPGMDIRLQLVINLVVLFLGTSVVVARRYGLDIRKAWSLRAPPRSAWLAVAIGVPSGLSVGQGVSQLSNLIFPVPERVLASFGGALLPEGIPAWQLLLMMTVLPGICEEVFFRGTLLHALRKRMGPVALCLVVGLVFGFFHVQLFRILPTGFLGVIFCAVTLMTGSIFPAMVWHALNNLLALSLGLAGFDAAAVPAWTHAVALIPLGLAFAILWRSRVSDPEFDTSGSK